MTTKTLIIFLFLFGLFSSDIQEDDYWVLQCKRVYKKNGNTRVIDDEKCGYVNAKGEEMIRFGKYSMCFTDTLRGYAIVADPESGHLIGINKKEETLFRVFIYDNGPDYVSEGFFRITNEKKEIGFADSETGEIIIPASLSAARPFRQGRAAFCEGCRSERFGEYSRWSGGKWGFLNTKGEKVIAPLFDDVISDFNEAGIAEVVQGERIFKIGRDGKEKK